VRKENILEVSLFLISGFSASTIGGYTWSFSVWRIHENLHASAQSFESLFLAFYIMRALS
jgi:hypothetical protein